MTLRYALISPFLAESYEHNLSHEEFRRLKGSRNFLKEYMRFEESVLQLMYSYQEFERHVLDAALNHYLFPLGEFNEFQDLRVRSNIRVMSFLNSLTSLRDQFPTFRGSTNLSDLRSAFQKKWEEQKTTSIEFAFCERLRNFAQHQTQPVKSVTTGGGWDENRTIREYRVSVYVDVKEVCFNRTISDVEKAKYLGHFGDKVDTPLLFRCVLDITSGIARDIRELSKQEFSDSIEEISKAITAASSYVERFLACEAVSIRGDEIIEKISLFDDFIKRANTLRSTHLIVNGERHFISNRSRGHTKPN